MAKIVKKIYIYGGINMKVIKKTRAILVLVILVVFVAAATITTFASVCTGTCRISNHAVLSEPTISPEYD